MKITYYLQLNGPHGHKKCLCQCASIKEARTKTAKRHLDPGHYLWVGTYKDGVLCQSEVLRGQPPKNISFRGLTQI